MKITPLTVRPHDSADAPHSRGGASSARHTPPVPGVDHTPRAGGRDALASAAADVLWGIRSARSRGEQALIRAAAGRASARVRASITAALADFEDAEEAALADFDAAVDALASDLASEPVSGRVL